MRVDCSTVVGPYAPSGGAHPTQGLELDFSPWFLVS